MKENGFQNFGKIIVRNPAYSYNILFDEKGNSKNLDDLLTLYLNEDKFIEGIYWSSIPLYEIILQMNDQELSDKKRSKIRLALQKYLIRAATRPTPYGTFAGTAITNISDNNNYSDAISEKKIRLDVNIVRKIIKSIENNVEIFSSIDFTVNNTLYAFYNQLRYLEIDKNGKNTSQISSFEKNNVLNFICSKSKKEKLSFNNLSKELSEFFERDELMIFFHELVESGFLISEIELRQTDQDELKYIRRFIEKEDFKNSKEISKYLNLLNSIESYTKIFENSDFGEFHLDKYRNIKSLFNNLNIAINDEQIFHIDVLNGQIDNFEISNKNINIIYEAVSILSKLIPRSCSQSQIQLKKFKKLFFEKYEADTVSLMEVLDPEIGIGFPANEHIGHFANNEILHFNEDSTFKEIEHLFNYPSWLSDKIENLSSGEKEINIWQNDLQEFKSRISDLPNTFNIVGQIISEDRILLQSVGGFHANALLSRFAYMHEEIKSLCDRITEFENEVSKDVIFAEIVWIPNDKIGNVTRKLTSKNYEIPIYYQSSLPLENQIFLDDILVLVEKDEIILKSKKLKKRIIPRLSSAHNYLFSNNPVYKFLCLLQDQKSSEFSFNPNFVHNKKRFFPRIIYKNIILHQCSWILQESDIIKIKNSQMPMDELNKFMERWNVNALVMLCQGDRELFLDISNGTYLNILLDEIYKNHKTIVLKEWLYPNNSNINQFVRQFILPIKKLEPISFKKLSQISQMKQKSAFPAGSEWLYFKIYCDAIYSDSILKKINTQIFKKNDESNAINKWFFIRFTDPHYHLRLRIKLNSTEFIGEIIYLLNQAIKSYVEKNIVWKINLDTYKPENERYLPSNIENAEYIFFKDSCQFTTMLEKKEFQDDINIRLFSAVKNVDIWLDLFCLTIKEKRDFCEKMKSSFAKEQSKNLILQIDNLYQSKIDSLESFLKSDKFAKLFKRKEEDLRKSNLDIRNLEDFIHMSINRWFRTNQRNWEYTTYYFCLRNYNKKLHCLTK